MTEAKKTRKAVFAGGCFWCTQADFRKLPGVVKAVSGYTGGNVKDPSYEAVSSGTTGHREAVEITYDPDVVSYDQLLDYYWEHVDPTDAGGQFHDRGSQYRTAVFYTDEEQRRAAERSKEELAASGKFDAVATEIRPAETFYPAEGYHQDYDRKQPGHYGLYRAASGRDAYHDRIWGGGGREGEESLRRRLTPLQYEVTRNHGTEPPFRNEYWDEKRDGLYVDVVSGEPLFSSRDKFDSGTGWPSFTRPVEPANVVTRDDRSHGMVRTEVRSRRGDSHLGHLFDDGPAPAHRRYCMNSAALRFIPKEDLEKEGYGDYRKLFEP